MPHNQIFLISFFYSSKFIALLSSILLFLSHLSSILLFSPLFSSPQFFSPILYSLLFISSLLSSSLFSSPRFFSPLFSSPLLYSPLLSSILLYSPLFSSILLSSSCCTGADLAPIVRQFITEKECLVRGLAHPVIFQGNASSNSQMERFQQFGAVEVSPQNIFAVSVTLLLWV